ncbi:bifunctional 5,10-methylenetetrahydrofolate dehydrogenase/5,10-methenyltetrahydrofolate cyclohydrolase [Metaclostridioides mangenotii]|uniref:bifunctional 5,10-methylenetetrahydrofolate dehydrogenase/5,10-methenyltetrahydrofolate cyclohydrolase n=1 Tax=Metaclostridioides mangenotii TaxID=1540 RepID=UPI0026ED63A3|nr:bifunctional 5,10-methylenetetrahydrofolate dehydrogenase/5,10-methenyltetrahydrofolate cyclohydrolase [Clostridioides mangenotii]
MKFDSTRGQIIKGKPVADKISEDLIKEVEIIKSSGKSPKLAIVRVGERPDDLSYERGALNRCGKIGIETEVVVLNEDVTTEEYIETLNQLNEDDTTNGILCFRPLPKHLDENKIKYKVSPQKDVDCFNPISLAKVVECDHGGFPPCTPTAVVEILKHYEVELKGRNVTVVGRSLVVGKPVSMLLLNENATVTICHSKTDKLSEVCSNADVLVAAVGRAKMIDDSYVKEGAVVIDVGINVDDEGNLCGDVDTEKAALKASLITPVPAGVGSVTTSILAKHVLNAYKLQN